MEIFTLDSMFRRIDVLDRFESLIWTERWQDPGDFQIDLLSSLENKTKLYPGTRLVINKSDRVMVVESTEDRTTDEGKKVLTVRGRSLEAALEDRTAQQTLNDITDDPYWIIPGTPVEVAEGMFDYICRDSPFPPALDPGDAFPYLQAGSLYSPGTIPEPPDDIWWEQRPAPLLYAITDVCKAYDLGYRFVCNIDASELYFDVYTGNDLTTRQTVNPAVIFSVALENYQNVTEYNSIRGVKNVAYVRSELGVRTVVAPWVDPSVSGFDRKVMYLDANFNSTSPPSPVQDALEQVGQEALAKRRKEILFDGEVNEFSEYKYGTDYLLGDLVEVRNLDGVVAYKRVSEQIFVHDQNGEREYPTLANGIFTDELEWISYSSDDVTWSEMTTEEWNEM